MSEAKLFRNPLKNGTTLEIYDENSLIFGSSGKWLYPLFEFEDFLKTFSGNTNNLSAHDTAIGKAAAVLMIRMNIKHINANLISELALNYIDFYNSKIAKSENEKVEIFYEKKYIDFYVQLKNSFQNFLPPMKCIFCYDNEQNVFLE